MKTLMCVIFRVVEENLLKHELARARALIDRQTGSNRYDYTYYKTYDEVR